MSYTIYYGRSSIPACVLEQCCGLYSNHYGFWKDTNKRIRMNTSLCKSMLLFDDNCGLVTCRVDDELVGHCFYARMHLDKTNKCNIWITQLVVHDMHRHQGIATSLIKHVLMLHNTNVEMIGIASSNPFAVMACQKASSIKFTLKSMRAHVCDVMESMTVPYLKQATSIELSDKGCQINTNFNIDHKESQRNAETLGAKGDSERTLVLCFGSLPDGYEYLAFGSITSPDTVQNSI
jgi:hypothetical protein